MFIERLLRRRIVVVLWIFFITVVSLFPGKKLPGQELRWFEGADKLAHSVIYAVLMLLIGLNFYSRKKENNWKISLLSILSVALFGVLMEILQFYLSFLERSFEVYDMIFNFLGALVGYGLFELFKQKL